MSGYDDPRYWRQQFEDLKKRMTTLEKEAIRRGPGGVGIQRVHDSAGNPLFDYQGLIAVVSTLASRTTSWGFSTLAGVAGPPNGITTIAGEVDVGGGNLTFQLSRQQTVQIEFLITAGNYLATPGVQGNAAPIYVRVQGQANSSPSSVVQGAGTTAPSPTGVTVVQLLRLPAGTYNVNAWWNSINSTNDRLDVYSYGFYVFQFGG